VTFEEILEHPLGTKYFLIDSIGFFSGYTRNIIYSTGKTEREVVFRSKNHKFNQYLSKNLYKDGEILMIKVTPKLAKLYADKYKSSL
jgi:hypothetical protein